MFRFSRRRPRSRDLARALVPLLAACSAVPQQQKLDAPLFVGVPLVSASISDQRARFRDVFCATDRRIGAGFPDRRPCEQALVQLGGGAEPGLVDGREPMAAQPRTLVFLAGLLGECVRGWGDPFGDSYERLAARGFRVLVAPLEGRSSSARNAVVLDEFLRERIGPAEDLIVIAHSKGAVDFLEATTLFEGAPWLARVRAFVSVAGAIGGSPLADRFQGLYDRFFARLPLPDCPAGDGGGLRSLTRRERTTWLQSHRLPATIAAFTLGAVPVSQPMNQTLAAFSERLDRIDPRHDGQLLLSDTFLPHSVFLGVVDADHWSVALPFNRSDKALATALADQNAYPREVLIEAILAMVEESLAGSPPAKESAR